MVGKTPNDPGFSCRRLARAFEFYVPLIAIGDQLPRGAQDRAPVSCKRWLGAILVEPRFGSLAGLDHETTSCPSVLH
jgi:hypothetical protein